MRAELRGGDVTLSWNTYGRLVAAVLGSIGVMTGVVSAQTITEFPVPTVLSGPEGIAAGPDGNLWFTEIVAGKIGRITTSGSITEFPLPFGGSMPPSITAGPDGNLWFTQSLSFSEPIGRITTAGSVTTFSAAGVPGARGIASGPDGNLWFTEDGTDKISRITPAGVYTGFPIPTAPAQPAGITAGPDGNLWFTEFRANKIGRITTSGAITEFTIPTAATWNPHQITAGPDGNLWFTENATNSIGRITPAGVITEFLIPTPNSEPVGIAAGPDGNLWFTESAANKIGRITPAGVITEFLIPTASSSPRKIAAGPDGSMWFTEGTANKIGRITTGPLEASSLDVNIEGNSVLESGEVASMAPAWKNVSGASVPLTGTLTDFTGPGKPDPAYDILDGTADYGTVAAGTTASCADAAGDCYSLLVSIPTSRPATHWDATATETLSSAQSKDWTLHIGDSFADVPRTNPFYRFVETLLHHSVTAGCSVTDYCPTLSTTRAQMAVFVLRAREGGGYSPPVCGSTPAFADVPSSDPFCPWIEELARRGVVSGCGGGNYCPDASVTRAQMAVFVLKTLDPSMAPPVGTTPIFNDVPLSDPFCRWIEELARRGVVVGCGGGNYCPTSAVNREQMGVFIGKGFELSLYGP